MIVRQATLTVRILGYEYENRKRAGSSKLYAIHKKENMRKIENYFIMTFCTAASTNDWVLLPDQSPTTALPIWKASLFLTLALLGRAPAAICPGVNTIH